MYNQQSFHSASYRGNQPGHDNYLRADSTRPSGFQAQGAGFASSATPVQSQYRGMQRSFQPTGYVQSVYGQNQQQQQQNQQQQQQNQQQQQQQQRQQHQQQLNPHLASAQQMQSQSPASYHAANYRGNQQGHDNYLRADSTSPSNFQNQASNSFQSQYQPQQTSMNFANNTMQNQAFQPSFQNQAQFQSQAVAAQNQNTQQFHTANYQGNQPGHDQYLRADSQQPSQAQFGRSF